jgi:1-acyl-sn-glycerol-3-phosphate acyltransferase
MSRLRDCLAALGFTVYVLALLAISVPPAWVVLLLLPRGRSSDMWSKRWARWLISASGCALTVSGGDHAPQGGPVVFVSNHASYLDSIVLMAALPWPYLFVVARAYAAWPIVGTAIRKAEYITVDRRSAATRADSFTAIEAALRNGSSVLIYPEGRRAHGMLLEPFRAGAFRAAVAAGRPVVPISVRGTRVIMGRGVRLLRRGSIDVTIHQPIAPTSSDRREIVRLRDTARSRIERRLEATEHPDPASHHSESQTHLSR